MRNPGGQGGLLHMMRRFGFGMFVGFAALAPTVVAWMLMLVLAPSAAPQATPVATPNPASPPPSWLSSLELLAYADPWFAGTIFFWLILWLPILFVYLVVSVAVLRPPGADSVSPFRRPLPLLTFSLFLGTVFAVPWFYGAFLFLQTSSQ